MKTTNPIASLFGKSPFKPMQEHMGIVNECVAEVPKPFEALMAGDKEDVVCAKEEISAKEHEADDIKNQIRGLLPKNPFMPVDRRDLLDIFAMQDSVGAVSVMFWYQLNKWIRVLADYAEEVSDRLRLFVAR